MKDDFIVSTHIPKTAGTTLANVFSRCYNRRIIFDYDGYESPQEPSTIIKNNSDFISSYFDVIHGHFFARKYFSVFPAAKFVSTVRHPVERVISQYVHELNEDSSDAWYHEEIASGRMDLPTFAAQPGVGDAMSIHLAGRPLSGYDLILVSEQLRLSLALFETAVRPLDLIAQFGKPPALPFDNVKTNRKSMPEITDHLRAAVFSCTLLDNEIYAEAESLLALKARKLSI